MYLLYPSLILLPLFFLCVQNVEAVARYIQRENRDKYERCGVTIGDPMDRGLRCVSS